MNKEYLTISRFMLDDQRGCTGSFAVTMSDIYTGVRLGSTLKKKKSKRVFLINMDTYGGLINNITWFG